MSSYQRAVVKLSGEALSGSTDSIIDPNTVENTIKAISMLVDSGAKVLIVSGAGNICRGALLSESALIDRVDADYMGMLGTMINALALTTTLNRSNIKAKALSTIEIPDFLEKYSPELANKYLDEGYVIVSGGGLGKPYYSTDTAAVQRAIDINADVILMAKNGVDGIYDSDPRHNKDAKLFKEISPQNLINFDLKVMDLSAAKLLLEHNIDVLVFNMSKIDNFKKAIQGVNVGTRVIGGKK